jgi:hypothetical protein
MGRMWIDLRSRAMFALAMLPWLVLTGCAQIPLGDPAPSFENIQKARSSRTAPVAVGQFKLAPGADPDIDKGVSVRSNAVFSPVDGSFSQYLRQTLITDLQASGLYDAASPASLSGFLTGSTLDVPMDTGKASLSARFVLVRSGKTVYDKALRADASWPSTFIGVEAIPAGINQYSSLYHKLVGQLLDDPDYQAANPRQAEK